jgi:hypothetical protein
MVDISYLQLGIDFVVHHIEHPPTAWAGIIYVSDIKRAWTWEPEELRPIYNIYIINQLRKLRYLETFVANNLICLSTLMAQELVDYSRSLKYVDFRKSGLKSNQPWAIKGTKEEVQLILREMEKTVLRSPIPGRPNASLTPDRM